MVEIFISRLIVFLVDKIQSAVKDVWHDCLQILRIALAIFCFHMSAVIGLGVDGVGRLRSLKQFPRGYEERQRIVLLLQVHFLIALLILRL